MIPDFTVLHFNFHQILITTLCNIETQHLLTLLSKKYLHQLCFSNCSFHHLQTLFTVPFRPSSSTAYRDFKTAHPLIIQKFHSSHLHPHHRLHHPRLLRHPQFHSTFAPQNVISSSSSTLPFMPQDAVAKNAVLLQARSLKESFNPQYINKICQCVTLLYSTISRKLKEITEYITRPSKLSKF